jgi:hypothetical protein
VYTQKENSLTRTASGKSDEKEEREIQRYGAALTVDV